VAPPTIRAQYERISEWLVTSGAEEVFPDAVALLRWRDRNQRMLPKLALDGVATRDSCEQLIHCLAPGDKDSQLVVYGYGVAQPIEVPPPLLSAWGGHLIGFNLARWVHALSANCKKMMAVMENVTKLVRANKYNMDTTLYKVGEDPVAEAFSRTADAAESTQIVLIFPSLAEELEKGAAESKAERERATKEREEAEKAKKEEDERERLKSEWLSLLFTSQSVAAMSPEGPLPMTLEAGKKRGAASLIVWVGDSPVSEDPIVRDIPMTVSSAAVVSFSWSKHPAGEGLLEFSDTTPVVLDGSWYLRNKSSFENTDLDLLHDVELLGRSLCAAIEPKLAELELDWKNVVILGFGKGAGIALYASLLQVFPKRPSAMVLFSPVVAGPSYLLEKVQEKGGAATPMKVFTIWGNRDRTTPGTYRQLLAQVLRKVPEVHVTPDTLPDGEHTFDGGSFGVLASLLPLCLPR